MSGDRSISIFDDLDENTCNNFSVKHGLMNVESTKLVINEVLSQNQKILIYTIAKQTLLSLICVIIMIINSIFYSIFVIDYYFANNGNGNDNGNGNGNGNDHVYDDTFNIRYNCIEIILSITYFLIAMTVWLSFAFADYEYIKICGKCHKWTSFICSLCAINQLDIQQRKRKRIRSSRTRTRTRTSRGTSRRGSRGTESDIKKPIMLNSSRIRMGRNNNNNNDNNNNNRDTQAEDVAVAMNNYQSMNVT